MITTTKEIIRNGLAPGSVARLRACAGLCDEPGVSIGFWSFSCQLSAVSCQLAAVVTVAIMWLPAILTPGWEVIIIALAVASPPPSSA